MMCLISTLVFGLIFACFSSTYLRTVIFFQMLWRNCHILSSNIFYELSCVTWCFLWRSTIQVSFGNMGHHLCPISWLTSLFPKKYLPTRLFDSLEMLWNSRLDVIFPQNFEGMAVQSGIYNCSRDIVIQILFLWNLILLAWFFLFSLTGSIENILCLMFWNLLMTYHGTESFLICCSGYSVDLFILEIHVHQF